MKKIFICFFVLALGLSLTLSACDVMEADEKRFNEQKAKFLGEDKEKPASEPVSSSVETLQKAAEQGDKYAQCNLGVMYYNGEGVKQDYALARQWFEKAAEQGIERAISTYNQVCTR